MAWPMPFDAPVTSATFPPRPRSMAHATGRSPTLGGARVAREPRAPEREQRDAQRGAEPVHAGQHRERRREAGERRPDSTPATGRRSTRATSSAHAAHAAGPASQPQPSKNERGSASARTTASDARSTPPAPPPPATNTGHVIRGPWWQAAVPARRPGLPSRARAVSSAGQSACLTSRRSRFEPAPPTGAAGGPATRAVRAD